MKEKMVKQYKCDFCGKKGYSKGHMNKHERHCTMNPDRACRMCVLVHGNLQPPIDELLAVLPDMETKEDEYGGVSVLNADEIE